MIFFFAFYFLLFYRKSNRRKIKQRSKQSQNHLCHRTPPACSSYTIHWNRFIESAVYFTGKKSIDKKNRLIKAFISDVRFTIESNSIESHSISELLAASTLAIIKLSNYSQLFFFRYFFIIETGDCDAFVAVCLCE